MFKFEYDHRKAAANLRKHGVSFDEAITVFEGDPSAYTDFDPDHSAEDERFFTIGISTVAECSSSVIMRGMARFASSAPAKPNQTNGISMKAQIAKVPTPKPIAKSGTAVRGKYFNQIAKGTNLAIIDPALHVHFPDSESVNRALRALLSIRESLKAASATPPKRQSRAA
jgi:uncharacterized DUF497 family protein